MSQRYTKEQYEQLINGSPVFEIDRVLNPALYEAQVRKFTELLTEYYLQCFYGGNEKNAAKFGYTLVIKARECLNSYDKSKGDFANYFNRSMKNALKRQKQDEHNFETRGGLKGINFKRIKSIVNRAKSNGWDLNQASARKKVAEAIGVSLKDLELYLDEYENAVTTTNTQAGEDGEQLDIFDAISSGEITAEEKQVRLDSFRERVAEYDAAFDSLQRREKQRAFISKMLTTKMVFAAREPEYLKIIAKACFCDKDIAKRTLKINKEIPQKVIAQECGLSEQSASRMWKNFTEKLKR